MDSRKLLAIFILVFTVAGAILYVAQAAYPQTFSIMSYSIGPSAQVQPTALASTEADVPVIITLKRPDVFSAATVSPQAFVVAMSEDLERIYGFETRNQMSTFEMVSGTLPRENLVRITQDTRVRAVFYDYLIRATDFSFSSQYTAQQVTIGEARAGLKLDELGDGSNINIVVIDSGAASPQFVQYAGTWAVAAGEPVVDAYGHGSLCSWIIQELAPNANLYSIKVLDAMGQGRASDVIRGIEIALREVPRPMVVNMSLGMPSSILDPLAESAGAAIAWNEGITIIAAAGNYGHGIVLSPAIADSVVAVGAVGRDLTYLDFSGGGVVGGRIKPDVCSYGVVYGLWLNEYKTAAGTSIAAPMVTATYARWLSSQPAQEKIDASKTVILGGIDLGENGPDTYYGVGGFLSGDVLAQVGGVERESPQGRVLVAGPLVGLAFIPAAVLWKKGKIPTVKT